MQALNQQALEADVSTNSSSLPSESSPRGRPPLATIPHETTLTNAMASLLPKIGTQSEVQFAGPSNLRRSIEYAHVVVDDDVVDDDDDEVDADHDDDDDDDGAHTETRSSTTTTTTTPNKSSSSAERTDDDADRVDEAVGAQR